MSTTTTLQEYNDGSLAQENDGLRHNIQIIGLQWRVLDNANTIHAFNRFEEEGFVERFQCHFRLVDIPRDAFYPLATPTIQE